MPNTTYLIKMFIALPQYGLNVGVSWKLTRQNPVIILHKLLLLVIISQQHKKIMQMSWGVLKTISSLTF